MPANSEDKPRLQTIPVANIGLDLLNPRVDEQPSQRDALRTIVQQQGDKVLNLADDIVQKGVDPSSLPIVIPNEGDAKTFVAVEGNRRVAALKILARPELVLDLVSDGGAKRLRALAAEFAKAPIRAVHCVVFEERESAHHWIELRHNGQQQGRGVVDWGGAESARFEERRGRTSRSGPALQALDLVRKSGRLSDHERERLHDVPITTVQRVLNDPYVRSRIGVEFEGGRLVTRLPDAEVLKALVRIIRDAVVGQLPVSRVDTKQLRKEYIDGFSQSDLPSPAAKTAPQSRAVTAAGTARSATQKPARSHPSSRTRHTVAPKTPVLSISDKKTNDIYWELRKLRIEGRDSFPLAAAVLFRCFLELSVDGYVRKHHLMPGEDLDQRNLKQKVQAVEKSLQESAKMTRKELVGVRRVTDENHFVAASIRTLHGYVHDAHFSPAPSDLIAAWNTLELFFTNIHE